MSKEIELLEQAYNMLEEYNKTGATKHNLLWKAMGNIEDALRELENEDDSPWTSVNDMTPSIGVEVITLTDKGTICFAHMVDKAKTKDYDGWNIPDVAFWMPFNMNKEMKEFYNSDDN